MACCFFSYFRSDFNNPYRYEYGKEKEGGQVNEKIFTYSSVAYYVH
jgi:hypothetical protein